MNIKSFKIVVQVITQKDMNDTFYSEKMLNTFIFNLITHPTCAKTVPQNVIPDN